MLSIYNLACCLCGKDANLNNTAAAAEHEDDEDCDESAVTEGGEVFSSSGAPAGVHKMF